MKTTYIIILYALKAGGDQLFYYRNELGLLVDKINEWHIHTQIDSCNEQDNKMMIAIIKKLIGAMKTKRFTFFTA